jgi:hypothetical protein
VTYAVTRRDVRLIEQHVHSFLEMIPLAALVLVSLLHWPQLKARLGLRVEPPAPIRVKLEPLDKVYVFGYAVGDAGPRGYAQELARDWADNAAPRANAITRSRNHDRMGAAFMHSRAHRHGVLRAFAADLDPMADDLAATPGTSA